MTALLGSVVRAIGGVLPEGLDQAAIAAEAGLTSLSRAKDDECDLDAFRRLWRGIMKGGDDPTLPLTIGAALPYGTYEVIDYLTGSCPDVASALGELARYFGLITPLFRWELDPTGPSVALVSRQPGPEDNLVFVQYILGVTLARFTELIDGGLELVEVQLGLAPLPDTARARHEAFFGCRVRYVDGPSRLFLTPASWSAPLARSEPPLRRVLERHAADLLAARPPDDGLAAVRVAIQEQLPKGGPELETVAKALAMSSRTLQRRLREAETTFQDLVAEERASAARAYLADARLGLEEVAFLLGYSEASAFSRAFKRWTGRTPADFRAS